MSPERFSPSENPERKMAKAKRSLKAVLGEILRLPDFYINTVLSPLNLGKTEITEDYKKRDLIDLGSGAGSRYGEIRSLFEPMSYLGVDNDPREIRAGKIKQLDMKQLDFLSEDLKGDMAVAFGTRMSPEIADKLKDSFNCLVFNQYAPTKEEAEGLVKIYKEKLDPKILDKIIIIKRSLTSAGPGYDIYFFIKTDKGTEESQQP